MIIVCFPRDRLLSHVWPALPVLSAVVCLLGPACGNRPPQEPQDYVSRLEAERAAKDAEFRQSDDVVPENRKAEFLPLAYFSVDPEYHVAAALKPDPEQTRVMMPTSTGQQRRMLQVGTLEFLVKGEPMRLMAVTETDLNRLTVMFSDATSGNETYPAGRYIELERTGTGVYELDFNRAFHPYCYYNPAYECPIPPAENRLPIPIRAGEKMKK
jgi:uncharacterized protein (DUF1684 family)